MQEAETFNVNPDNENIYDTDYDNDEVERFAKEATNGTWLMIPGISDFKNINCQNFVKNLSKTCQNNY
jgi:hypothetical protein